MNFGSEIIRDMFGSCDSKEHLRNLKVINIARNDNYNLNVCYDESRVFFIVNCDEHWNILTDLFYSEEVWLGNRFYYADFGLADILRTLKLELNSNAEIVPNKVWEIDKQRSKKYGLLTHRLELLKDFLSAKAKITEYRPYCKGRLIDVITGELLISGDDVPDFTEETLAQVNELLDFNPDVTSFDGWYQITYFWHDFINHKSCITYAFINEDVTKCYVTTTVRQK